MVPSAIVRVVLLGEWLDDANIFGIPNDHEIRARERGLGHPRLPRARASNWSTQKHRLTVFFSQWDFEQFEPDFIRIASCFQNSLDLLSKHNPRRKYPVDEF